jgi:hypothetical protein
LGKKLTDIEVKRSGRDWETNKGRRVKLIWIYIGAGYVYLSHEAGRAYWVLANISPETRPRISFVEATRTMRINTYRVRFMRPADFAFAQACLAQFTRRG